MTLVPPQVMSAEQARQNFLKGQVFLHHRSRLGVNIRDLEAGSTITIIAGNESFNLTIPNGKLPPTKK